jgi:hypothetical chaperone protein
LIENNLGYSLFRSIETTKIELSSSDVSRFVFEESGIEIEERISINKYETIIEHDLIRMENYLNIFLDKHSIRSNEVDSLFLTGGTSLVSGVKKLFRNKFPNTPIRDGNTFISVAQGLAYSGYLFE